LRRRRELPPVRLGPIDGRPADCHPRAESAAGPAARRGRRCRGHRGRGYGSWSATWCASIAKTPRTALSDVARSCGRCPSASSGRRVGRTVCWPLRSPGATTRGHGEAGRRMAAGRHG
jgi:hypothetical protein